METLEKSGPLQEFYLALVKRGIRPGMARLTVARKIAAITLAIWKKGVSFDAKHLKQQNSLSVSAKTYYPSLELISGGGQSDS